MELTNAETALLGLLAEGASHPYQIEKEVKMRDMRYWTDLSMSSIYKLLKKLEKQGAVLSHTEISEENRARRVYSLSPDGERMLKSKLEQLLSEPEHIKWRMDIGISNLALLPVAVGLSCLEKYRETLRTRIEDYQRLLAYLKAEECSPHRHALARRPIALLHGELVWVTEYIEELKAGGELR